MVVHMSALAAAKYATVQSVMFRFVLRLPTEYYIRCADDAGGAGMPEPPPEKSPSSSAARQPQQDADRPDVSGSADAAAFRRAAQAMNGSNTDETLLQELLSRTRCMLAVGSYQIASSHCTIYVYLSVIWGRARFSLEVKILNIYRRHQLSFASGSL